MSIRQRLIQDALRAGIDPEGDRRLTFSSWIEGLKWADMPDSVASFAAQSGLSVVSLSREPAGLLRERARFKLQGDESQVWRFIQSMGAAMDQYNEEPAPRPARQGFLAKIFG